MPSFFTHKAAGERVLGKLDIGAVAHNEAFYLGCQGPDILYSSKRVFRGGLRLGLKMHHKKTNELLRHALEYLKNYDKKDKGELASYLAGFIVHYAVDKSTHPFVYDKSGRNFGIHHAMEYLWDSFTSKEEWDMEMRQHSVYSELLYGELGEGISDWYISAAKDVYKVKLHRKTTKRAHLNFAKAKQKIFSNPGYLKRLFLWITSGLKVKEMHLSSENEHPLFSSEDFFELQDMVMNAVNEACSFIGFMFRYDNGIETHLPNQVVEKNFSGESLRAVE